jgi:Ca2+-transporting ATPase
MSNEKSKFISHKRPETTWWSFKMDDIWQKLDSTSAGIKTSDAQKRLKQYGLNELPKKESENWFDLFINQLKSLLVIILLIASLISLVLGDTINAGIILLVIIINVIVGFWQEFKTSQALEALQKIVIHKAKIIREGEEKIILTKDLVPGDIVLLSAGDKIPADLRLFKTNNLKINEAVLTGESEPREKKCGLLEKETVLAERINLAFMGTLVAEGNGKGIVIETGANTALGQIASLVSSIKDELTPLQKKLDHFAIFLTKIIISIAFLIFILGLIYGHSL